VESERSGSVTRWPGSLSTPDREFIPRSYADAVREVSGSASVYRPRNPVESVRAATGLDALASDQPYAAQQIRRWRRQWEATATPSIMTPTGVRPSGRGRGGVPLRLPSGAALVEHVAASDFTRVVAGAGVGVVTAVRFRYPDRLVTGRPVDEAV
jgi:hypothetical protein